MQGDKSTKAGRGNDLPTVPRITKVSGWSSVLATSSSSLSAKALANAEWSIGEKKSDMLWPIGWWNQIKPTQCPPHLLNPPDGSAESRTFFQRA